MSVLVIRNDDDYEEVYNRTTVFCYTRMALSDLWDYVKTLELLADDRQALFFKIDFDIYAAPASMPDLNGWLILSIVLKAHTRPFDFGIFVKLFYERFPFKMNIDFSTVNLLICSASMTHSHSKYAPLTPTELDAFNRLSNHHKRTFANSIEASKRFKEEAQTASEVPALLVQMAKKYELHGGHWILFFNKMEPPRREETFTKTFEAAIEHWGRPISRFNAKISTDNFIICFGNKFTQASVDPTILESNNKNKSVELDFEPFQLLSHIDELYDQNPTLFGQMSVNYKPDIVSACCIQRDNFIRPTVYQARYGFFTSTFRPVPTNLWQPKAPKVPSSISTTSPEPRIYRANLQSHHLPSSSNASTSIPPPPIHAKKPSSPAPAAQTMNKAVKELLASFQQNQKRRRIYKVKGNQPAERRKRVDS